MRASNPIPLLKRGVLCLFLVLLLSACATPAPVVARRVERIAPPAWMYDPTPVPLVPDPLLNLDLVSVADSRLKALLACNADKLAIGQWAINNPAGVSEIRETVPAAPASKSPGLLERMRTFFIGG